MRVTFSAMRTVMRPLSNVRRAGTTRNLATTPPEQEGSSIGRYIGAFLLGLGAGGIYTGYRMDKEKEFREAIEESFPGSIGLLSNITGTNYHSISSTTAANENKSRLDSAPNEKGDDATPTDDSKQWILYDPKVYYKPNKSESASQLPISTDDVLSEIEAIRQEVDERCELKPGDTAVTVPVIDGTESNTIVTTAEKTEDLLNSEATERTTSQDNASEETPGTNDSGKVSVLTTLLGKPGAKPASSLEAPLYDPGVYYKPKSMQTSPANEANAAVLAELEALRRHINEKCS